MAKNCPQSCQRGVKCQLRECQPGLQREERKGEVKVPKLHAIPSQGPAAAPSEGECNIPHRGRASAAVPREESTLRLCFQGEKDEKRERGVRKKDEALVRCSRNGTKWALLNLRKAWESH